MADGELRGVARPHFTRGEKARAVTGRDDEKQGDG
jgi:hypothetical protein